MFRDIYTYVILAIALIFAIDFLINDGDLFRYLFNFILNISAASSEWLASKIGGFF